MKYLRVTMPDGSKWDVPVNLIAESRANYYETNPSQAWTDEFVFALSDPYTLRDWSANNMNWEDVAEHATLAMSKQLSEDDFQEGWVNGEKEIVEK